MQIPCLRKGQILFCKRKTTLIPTIFFLKLVFLIDNIFGIFTGRVFNRQPAFLWVPNVSLLFVRVRLHTWVSEEKRKEENLIL